MWVKCIDMPFVSSYKENIPTHMASQSRWYGLPYMMQLEQLRDDELHTIYVDFEHVQKSDEALAEALIEQYYRYDLITKSIL